MPWPAWLTDADVLEPIEDQPLVHLVRDAHNVMLLAEAGHQLQLFPGEHLRGPSPTREAISERCEHTARAGAKGFSALSYPRNTDPVRSVVR